MRSYKRKKSSTLTKDTEEVAKAEKVKSEEPPKTDISSEEEDDEGFDEFMLPKECKLELLKHKRTRCQIYHKFLAALAI